MPRPPLAPPDAWFTDPRLSGPTPLDVTDAGRVYGHLATWGTCHRGLGGPTGRCVPPPRSACRYAQFHTGRVVTASGRRLPVGVLTAGTGHAGPRLGADAAVSHYDHTGWVAAVVRAGEDTHGIWVAGAVVPEATPAQVATLRRCPLSGDWRQIGGRLELVAALSVPTPGFPVLASGSVGPVSLAASAGPTLSLVAAGALRPAWPSVDDMRREAAAARNLHERIDALTARMHRQPVAV